MTTGVATVVYVLMGVFGAALYGQSTDGDIMVSIVDERCSSQPAQNARGFISLATPTLISP